MTRGYGDPKVFAIRNDGEPAVMPGRVMKPNSDGLRLGEALNAEAAAMHHALPTGLPFTTVADQKVGDDAIHGFKAQSFTRPAPDGSQAGPALH